MVGVGAAVGANPLGTTGSCVCSGGCSGATGVSAGSCGWGVIGSDAGGVVGSGAATGSCGEGTVLGAAGWSVGWVTSTG